MTISTGEEAMVRPLKRRRLSPTPEYSENDDLEEDDQEPTEEWDLQAARAQNDMRLKSIFEGIFAKYGRDFTDVGDEIDLQTGKIVVDNGHLSGMREEGAGQATETWLHEAALSDEDAAEKQDTDRGDEDGSSNQPPGPGPFSNYETAKSPLNNASADPGFAFRKGIKSSVLEAQDVPNVPEPFFKDPGPMDPVWQVPELPTLFPTPTAETKRTPPKLPKLIREVTPPGSGSLWSVPRRGRPRTEGKPRATPSKSRPRAKRKYHSSPMAHDWSFAATPDGDESDDPLQEFEPSPSKRVNAKTIRGRLMHAKPASASTDSPLSRQPLPDTQPPGQSASKAELSPKNNHAKNDAQNHVALENNYSLHDSSVESHSQISPIPPGNSPAKPRGWAPDEAKLIVRMRHIQKRWQEILDLCPNRKMSAIAMWYKTHWADRHKSPPPLSAPWTPSEMQTLDELKDETGMSWKEIWGKFPDRTHAEIEFELMNLWVKDDVGLSEGPRAPELTIEQVAEAEEQPDEESDAESDASDEVIASIEEPVEPFQESVEKDDSFVFDKVASLSFESFLGSDDGDKLPAYSPSRMSSIQIDSPVISRKGSRTPRRSPTKRLKFTI